MRFTPMAGLSALGTEPYATLFRHGPLEVEFYRPQGTDLQQPHSRDELYCVISGSGWFTNAGRRHRFEPGDLLFVAAGEEHRFDDFSEDFATWAIFYGPERTKEG
jgi:mannose-6-phosphate isomerase-like protein (cupin superfamily)